MLSKDAVILLFMACPLDCRAANKAATSVMFAPVSAAKSAMTSRLSAMFCVAIPARNSVCAAASSSGRSNGLFISMRRRPSSTLRLSTIEPVNNLQLRRSCSVWAAAFLNREMANIPAIAPARRTTAVCSVSKEAVVLSASSSNPFRLSRASSIASSVSSIDCAQPSKGPALEDDVAAERSIA